MYGQNYRVGCPVTPGRYHRARETTIDTPIDPPGPAPDSHWAAPDSPWAVPGARAAEPAPRVVAPRWGSWTPPPDERTITVGGVLGDAWRTYRRAFGPLLLIGTVIGLLTILLSLPTQVYTIRTYDALLRLIVDAVQTQENHTGITDPVLLRTQIEAIVNMPLSTAITLAIAGGAATGLGILGSCVLTAAALTARAGRRVSPAAAVITVLARGSALVLPAVLLAVGSATVTLAVQLSSGTLQDSDFTSSGGTSTAQNVLTVAAILVALGIFYLSVRWGLAIAAILVEDVGLRAGLRRSSELTRGHRLRLAAIVIIVALLQALTVTLPAVVVGVVVGMGTASVSSGIVAFALTGVVGSALWAPISSAVAAVAYGRLTERESGAIGVTRPA